MIRFSSSREKRLWIFAGLVFLAIYASLFLPVETQILIQNPSIQVLLFVTGMILVAVALISSSFNLKTNKKGIAIILGFIAVYFMLFLRLGLPERSHVIEYSVLAIFIHNAIKERFSLRNIAMIKLAFAAFIITLLIGTIDELIQLFLPHRVFDVVDILFNGLAALLAISFQVILQKVRN